VIFNPSLTELTTAATDAVIAVASLGCISVLRRYRVQHETRVRIWTWVFGLLAIASLLGALAHGLDLATAVRSWLWRPLYLSLGLVVALFVIAAVFDLRGETAARRLLLPLLALAFAFFALTQVGTGSFRIFIAYEAVAMLVALGVYGWLAFRKELEGSGIIAAGIVLNLLAAAVQASGSVSLTLVVPFDHNGVFHLLQLIALVVLTIGLVRGMRKSKR